MTDRVLADEHRPADPALLAREAQRLAEQGLTLEDIGAALRLDPAAVGRLLALSDGPAP